MYLKALEIQGFKSFPDKTVLSFDRDITAIVGPNGSGKSNISDAVRWVLGEQSTKQLRGSRMEDVIFGGTSKRPQMGYAEVSLVLDNADGALGYDAPEVMVTRRYYRSGEGEYFINRQASRLKDVTELFMDTGLGREGYSNISQGRIDEILALKSTDRREIFEEAAGISKYRYRKQEAERRLQSTEDNLLRLGDKLSELELQLTPLQAQAETAKRYLLLRDSLKSLEVSLWLRDMGKLRVQAEKTAQDLAAATAQLDQSNAALEQLYREAEERAQDLRRRDEQIQALRDGQNQAERDQAQAERETAVLRTNFENNAQNIQRLTAELTQQADRAGSVSQQLADRRARLEQLDAQETQSNGDRQQAQAAYDALADQVRGLADGLAELEARRQQTGALLAEIRGSLSVNAGSEQTLLDRETAILQERSQVLLRRESAQAQLEQCLQDRKAAQGRLEQAQNKLNGFALRETARQEALEEQNRRLSQAGVERRTLQAKMGLLQEMQREYEGFSKAVKLVLRERDRGALQGVHGPVPELIQTRDDYAVAIETALGGSMQSIVVESEDVGKTAIRMLKARAGGRATFLPLNVIRGRTLTEKNLAACPGYLGLACELVTYDPQYDGVIRDLLGRTAIADTLDNAVQIANRYGHRFRLVTLDGQVLNAGGAMTGGSAASSAGVLSRANELARLEQQEQTLLDRETAAQTAAQEAQKALAETRREASAAREGLMAATDELADWTGRMGRQELLLQTLEEALTTAKTELEALQNKLNSGRDQAGALENRMSGVQQNLEALEAQIRERTRDKTGLEDRQAAAGEVLTRLRLEASARQAEVTAARQSLKELEDLSAAMTGDETRRQALIADYQSQNTKLEAEIALLQDRTEDLGRQAEQARQQTGQALTDRAAAEMKKTSTERQQQEANRNILLLERERARLEQKQAASELEEKQLSDKLWDSYELTVSTAAPLAQPVTEETTRSLGELRRKISALGNPNLGAIEEFDRVNERYTYLTTQRDDVQTSKNELLGVIDRLTGEMTEIFSREFLRIRAAFAETFTEMFGGGQASVELEDPDNVLDCGIEIRVQPPGKQLKTITLLSGGEKAFVAIALYFAILKVRPTPFCILDEIDAALDDRNVDRFAQYLRRFTAGTQFILITHRRGTMEASDVLYGVTMVQQGVSQMLTLDLSRVEQQLHMQAT